MHTLDELAKALQVHYSRFNVAKRLLFTGHSHQAWPDLALQGLVDAFDAAATEVDHKWNSAFQKADVLRGYLRSFYNDAEGQYSLAANTHDLFIKWLSSFPVNETTHYVTTDSEFYSVARQFKRFEEAGIAVTYVAALPLEGFTARLKASLRPTTTAVILSRVYFQEGLINTELRDALQLLQEREIPVLVDDYHGTNVFPLDLSDPVYGSAYYLIGGYKYLQWGEGNCFLRYPKQCTLRPVLTGWFASFSSLSNMRPGFKVEYDAPNNRFSGATVESVSQFRAARVVEFFNTLGMKPEVLEFIYHKKVARLREAFLALDLDPSVMQLKHAQEDAPLSGFLALRAPKAVEWCEALHKKGVLTDARHDTLRFGPAPYTTMAQIDEAMYVLKVDVNA